MDTVTLNNNQYVFNQIIRNTTMQGTNEDKSILIDPNWSTLPLLQTGQPTYKHGLLTTTGNKTREYMPTILDPIVYDYLDRIPGTTWIPVSTTSKNEIFVLSIVEPRLFQDITITFQWDSKCKPNLPTIAQEFNRRPPKQRFWNLATGRSNLATIKPTNSPNYTNMDVKQTITVTIPDWGLDNIPNIRTIINRSRQSPPHNPHRANIYLRRRLRKLNHYFVAKHTPSPNGITVHFGMDTLFFQRIIPVSGPTFRFIYKELSRHGGPNDWTNLCADELCVLSNLVPSSTHYKLTNLLQN
jgi:hypothetical protein